LLQLFKLEIFSYDQAHLNKLVCSQIRYGTQGGNRAVGNGSGHLAVSLCNTVSSSKNSRDIRLHLFINNNFSFEI